MEAFLRRYPLKLSQACLIPVLERMILAHFGAERPWPRQQRVEDFLRYFGYTQGAIRTALSRAKAQQEFVPSGAAEGKRLLAGEQIAHSTRLFLSEPFAVGDFTLLLFHFATHQTQERARLKEMLSQFNFRMLTQNAYLRYGARSAEIQAFLEAQGFAEHLYCFPHLTELPARLIDELPELYQLPAWAPRLVQAQTDFTDFLAMPGPVRERYWRYLFARASFHSNLLTRAPYLPEAYFPQVRLTQAIFATLTSQAVDPDFVTAYAESFA